MKRFELNAMPRVEGGKKALKALRAQGCVPAVLNGGKIVEIQYTTYDYAGDGHELTKPAFVYLPPQYDETKQYNVLYLMHGVGGNEREWGMTGNGSQVKKMMDNLIAFGDIEPFIVVTPNGRSCADFANTGAKYDGFYLFGQELKNDLIPYIDANFATYAEYDENGYDLTALRCLASYRNSYSPAFFAESCSNTTTRESPCMLLLKTLNAASIFAR